MYQWRYPARPPWPDLRSGHGAALAGGEARSGDLLDEDRQAGGPRTAGDRVRHRRIPAGDDHAAAGVDAVGEVIAKAAVLACGHARRAAIANSALVDEAARRVGNGDLPLGEVGRVRDLSFEDVRLHIWDGLTVVD